MALINCPECNKQVSDKATSCPNCGHPVQLVNEPLFENYYNAAQRIKQSAPIKIKSGLFKRLLWFLLVNAGIVLSVSILFGGALVGATPFLLLVGCFFPFIALIFSKSLAIKTHKIRILKEGSFTNSQEASLYALVKSLSERAEIKKMPEVGIYYSDDMNAFATGPSKNSSLVAFSSSILNGLDESAIAGVAAHEIAHIANGDMVTLSLVQSVINSIVLLITIPLSVVKILALFSDKVDWLAYLLISLVKFIVTSILLLLGSLVVKAFSRRREFHADNLAARLVNKENMIHALELLGQGTVVVSKDQKAYAAFKINSPKHLLDIFSTHPSIERRIARLKNIK